MITIEGKQYDYYEILEISPETFSQVDLKEIYKKKALQYHPDKNKNSAASEWFNAVKTASDVLSDSAQRQEYDRKYMRGLIITINGSKTINLHSCLKQANLDVNDLCNLISANEQLCLQVLNDEILKGNFNALHIGKLVLTYPATVGKLVSQDERMGFKFSYYVKENKMDIVKKCEQNLEFSHAFVKILFAMPLTYRGGLAINDFISLESTEILIDLLRDEAVINSLTLQDLLELQSKNELYQATVQICQSNEKLERKALAFDTYLTMRTGNAITAINIREIFTVFPNDPLLLKNDFLVEIIKKSSEAAEFLTSNFTLSPTALAAVIIFHPASLGIKLIIQHKNEYTNFFGIFFLKAYRDELCNLLTTNLAFAEAILVYPAFVAKLAENDLIFELCEVYQRQFPNLLELPLLKAWSIVFNLNKNIDLLNHNPHASNETNEPLNKIIEFLRNLSNDTLHTTLNINPKIQAKITTLAENHAVVATELFKLYERDAVKRLLFQGGADENSYAHYKYFEDLACRHHSLAIEMIRSPTVFIEYLSGHTISNFIDKHKAQAEEIKSLLEKQPKLKSRYAAYNETLKIKMQLKPGNKNNSLERKLCGSLKEAGYYPLSLYTYNEHEAVLLQILDNLTPTIFQVDYFILTGVKNSAFINRLLSRQDLLQALEALPDYVHRIFSKTIIQQWQPDNSPLDKALVLALMLRFYGCTKALFKKAKKNPQLYGIFESEQWQMLFNQWGANLSKEGYTLPIDKTTNQQKPSSTAEHVKTEMDTPATASTAPRQHDNPTGSTKNSTKTDTEQQENNDSSAKPRSIAEEALPTVIQEIPEPILNSKNPEEICSWGEEDENQACNLLGNPLLVAHLEKVHFQRLTIHLSAAIKLLDNELLTKKLDGPFLFALYCKHGSIILTKIEKKNLIAVLQAYLELVQMADEKKDISFKYGSTSNSNLARKSDDPEFQLNLARQCMNTGNHAKAGESYYLLGIQHEEKGEGDKAFDHYEKAAFCGHQMAIDKFTHIVFQHISKANDDEALNAQLLLSQLYESKIDCKSAKIWLEEALYCKIEIAAKKSAENPAAAMAYKAIMNNINSLPLHYQAIRRVAIQHLKNDALSNNDLLNFQHTVKALREKAVQLTQEQGKVEAFIGKVQQLNTDICAKKEAATDANEITIYEKRSTAITELTQDLNNTTKAYYNYDWSNTAQPSPRKINFQLSDLIETKLNAQKSAIPEFRNWAKPVKYKLINLLATIFLKPLSKFFAVKANYKPETRIQIDLKNTATKFEP